MTIDSKRMARGVPAAPPPVPPALVVRVVLRPMTRLNPLIARLAGRRNFRMAALVRHVGRRSGRTYQTPVSARRTGHVVIIALTFGNQSDWSRNVRAAGGCSIRLDGNEYIATAPEFLSRQEARPDIRSAFSPVERASLRLLGIRQFLRLRIAPAAV